MKLSIITICYNIKDEIERTCQSIVAQTNQDFEWIVVDGGSTDGTKEILEKYKERINIFISEPDTGIYNAMNKGIKKASGEYLNFMNGGDSFASADVIEKFYNADIQNADVIYGNVNFIKKNSKKTLEIFPDCLDKLYFGHSCINHQSAFIKHSLFDKYGLYDEQYKIAADWEKWIVFAKNNCVFHHIDQVIADFRCDGISHTQKEKLRQENQKIISAHFSPEEQKQIQQIRHKTKFYLFNFIPVYKIIKKSNASRHYLFGFIPFLKIKEK